MVIARQDNVSFASATNTVPLSDCPLSSTNVPSGANLYSVAVVPNAKAEVAGRAAPSGVLVLIGRRKTRRRVFGHTRQPTMTEAELG